MAPLILLYEVSIVLSAIMVRRRANAEPDSDSAPEHSVPLLFIVGVATAGWRNRKHRTVSVAGV